MIEKTGRQLDAEIARVVFGLELPLDYPLWGRDGQIISGACPRFSTDMGAAWRVVEVMERRKWWFEMVRRVGDRPPYDTPGWFVRFRFVGGESQRTQKDALAVADTAPEAICRCALELFGENDD